MSGKQVDGAIYLPEMTQLADVPIAFGATDLPTKDQLNFHVAHTILAKIDFRSLQIKISL
jgi:hypothetical protein